MLFMVIEHFNGNGKKVYDRFKEKGRMMPEGLSYVASWTETNCDRCFQIMECDDPALLEEWTSNWNDIVEYQFIPVLSSKEMSEKMTNQL